MGLINIFNNIYEVTMSNRYSASCPLDCKVYVGGLPRTASRDEIESAFGRYGKLSNVFVARNPPGFAFVEFADPQDAEDSVRALDGRMICGSRVRVEISHGKTKPKERGHGGRNDGGYRDRGDGGDRGDRGDRGYNDRRERDRPRYRSRTPEPRVSNDKSRSRSTSKSRNSKRERLSDRSRTPPRHKSSRNRMSSRSRS